MGGDRNALLPPGTAVPRPKRGAHQGQQLTLPSKRSRSCYDPDIDPLYCAWGVNVYELFVNTKSDLGVPNPFIPDDGARAEYLRLPKHEQERLGFEHLLFTKLQDLVRQCDRVVSRNKEKLEQEIKRNAAKNNNNSANIGRMNDFYVQDIDEIAIGQLAQCQMRLDAVEVELLQIYETMEGHLTNQIDLENKIQDIKTRIDEMELQLGTKQTESTQEQDGTNGTETKESDVVAKMDDTQVSGQPKLEDESDLTKPAVASTELIKDEKSTDESIPIEAKPDIALVKIEPDTDDRIPAEDSTNGAGNTSLELLRLEMEELTKELDDVILKKQRSQFDLARKIQQYAPLQESAEQQRKHLHFVKSDITMDKTVCEVSGNFMSARDADERIAAHYAGKQYVGWKLVRDKFKEMQQQYGRYGPPRPQPRRDDAGPGGRHGSLGPGGGGSGRPDDRFSGRGGGFNSTRGPPPPGRGGGGGYGSGGRDYDRGRGGYHGGGGGYARGGGGGYDRDRRDGGGRWGR